MSKKELLEEIIHGIGLIGCGGTLDPCSGGPYIDPFTPQYNTCCGGQFCINGRCNHP